MSTQAVESSETGLVQRPLARRDLGAWPLQRRNGHLWCVGSAEADRYVSVPRSFSMVALEIAALLDGTRTLDEVSRAIEHSYPGITSAHVHRFYQVLSSSNLILSPCPTRIHHSEVRQLSLDVAKLDISGLTRMLAIAFKTPLWWFLNCVGLVIIAFAVRSIILNPEAWSARLVLVSESYTLGLLISLAFTGFVVLWHEIGHGFVAVRYGLRPHTLRLALYAGIAPLVYLDVRGLYTLPLGKRITVWLGGVWANLCGAAVLIVLVTHVSMPVLAQQVIWKLVLVNLMFIPVNLSPFMPTDGYFILCNLVGQLDLRTRLWQQLRGKWLRQGTSSRIGYLAWLYMGISLAVLLASGAFWLWWIWHICLEIFMAVSGPPLLRWGAALLVPAALALCLAFLGTRKRRIRHANVRQTTGKPHETRETEKAGRHDS
jgi:hypothetical protein